MLVVVLRCLLLLRIHNRLRREIRIVFNPTGDERAMQLQAGVDASDIARGVQVKNTFAGLPGLRNIMTVPLLSGGALEQDPIYYHLKHIICAGDIDLTNYFCRWFSYVIQARCKSEIAPVFYGGHGAGKSKFVKKLGEILGEHYYNMQNAQDILVCGDDYERAILVFCDELRKLDLNLYSRYKAAISEDKQQVTLHNFAQLSTTLNNFGQL